MKSEMIFGFTLFEKWKWNLNVPRNEIQRWNCKISLEKRDSRRFLALPHWLTHIVCWGKSRDIPKNVFKHKNKKMFVNISPPQIFANLSTFAIRWTYVSVSQSQPDNPITENVLNVNFLANIWKVRYLGGKELIIAELLV